MVERAAAFPEGCRAGRLLEVSTFVREVVELSAAVKVLLSSVVVTGRWEDVVSVARAGCVFSVVDTWKVPGTGDLVVIDAVLASGKSDKLLVGETVVDDVVPMTGAWAVWVVLGIWPVPSIGTIDTIDLVASVVELEKVKLARSIRLSTDQYNIPQT